MNQLAKMPRRTRVLIAPMLRPKPTPMTAPTSVWVVLTGSPILLATTIVVVTMKRRHARSADVRERFPEMASVVESAVAPGGSGDCGSRFN